MTIENRATPLLAGIISGTGGWTVGRHDPDTLMDAAIAHGVDALVWRALDGPGNVNDRLHELIAPRVRAAAARDLFTKRDLQKVMAALASCDVPALVTKGAALAYTVYPDPWLRPRTDTDLLVRHADVAAATAALEACGYARSTAVSTGELVSHQIAFERSDGHGLHHVIDLHWKIVNPQVVADALTFDELWRDAAPVPTLGAAARVPSAIGSLALACVHRLAHHQDQDRLIWLYDLKLLGESLDARGWTAFQELACSHRIAGFCLHGLRASRSILAGPLPAAVEEALAAAAPAEPSKAYMEGAVSRRDVLLSDLKVLNTWSDRLRLMREHAFPPAAFIQQRYGTTARWLLPALYLRRLITGAAKWGRS